MDHHFRSRLFEQPIQQAYIVMAYVDRDYKVMVHLSLVMASIALACVVMAI